ncbi:MAG: hypothetical protein LBI92_05060 [Azoarcus sp.]|jgi:hypothetical protein|nr:hypothetical protein [Azoarcus sp.]
MAHHIASKVRCTIQATVFWATMFIAVFALLTLTAGSHASENDAPENPDIERGMTMRNEIVEFVLAEYGDRQWGMQIDFTHLVEKYIKIGDDFESTKELLSKNGFKVHDDKGLKEYMTDTVYGPNGRKIVRAKHNTYRVFAAYKMKYPMKWTKPLYKFRYYDWKLQIFLGRSPESERVDRLLAVANLRAF